MNWKCETRLDDLAQGTRLEITCVTCGVARFEDPRDLITKARLGGAFLDKVEQSLSCMARPRTPRHANSLADRSARSGGLSLCRGTVSLSIVDDQPLRAVAGE